MPRPLQSKARKKPPRLRGPLAVRVDEALASQDPKREDQEVARSAGLSPEWLTAVKNGHITHPPADKLEALAKELGKPATYFTEVLKYILITKDRPLPLAKMIAEIRSTNWTREEQDAMVQIAERAHARAQGLTRPLALDLVDAAVGHHNQ